MDAGNNNNNPVQRNRIIKENLDYMEAQAHKKRKAQEIYYETHVNGESPIFKEDRPLVHQRLGGAVQQKTIKLRRIIPNHNPHFVKPRIRVRQDGIYTQRYQQRMYHQQHHHFGARNIAQKRLELLRTNLRGNLQKKIILRRKRLNLNESMLQQQPPLRRPLDFSVTLNNPTVQPLSNVVHSVRKCLNKHMQKEIELVQAQCVEHASIPNVPIHICPTGVTSISMHNRFSSYP